MTRGTLRVRIEASCDGSPSGSFFWAQWWTSYPYSLYSTYMHKSLRFDSCLYSIIHSQSHC